ncbi:acetyl-CoA synthetase-like protein [Fistulina hepatica ATCC 64428]|uniref:Acetyl-CoA synthetase-like protein n=1 Tax=Fistulina hepatica ATCC 64428 TaxID=1128425 RepID=A0A0D7A3W1_9AGAR|nr:acetyl-CoA synthetase-like protein [Fistulina hepatica ATCC 64428]
MSPALKSQLSVLAESAALYPDALAFRVPEIDPATGQVLRWDSVTYAQFLHDVEHFARYWSRAFVKDNIPQRSVIGMWIGGLTYLDVLQIYGISRAGYTPQLFSLKLPNPDVVFELLHRANAKALVYDTAYASAIREAHVPTYRGVDARTRDLSTVALPPLPNVDGRDTAMIFHTSGSTSGSPKLVPCSYIWLDSAIRKSYQVTKRIRPSGDVTVWLGSMCHIGQTSMLLGFLQHGACTVQPPVISFSPAELTDMIQRCGLNRLCQFAAFLAANFRRAMADAKFRDMLLNLDEILYSGMPLSREEEQWALQSGMKLINLFGSTELGAILVSTGGRNPLLRQLEGVSYEFRPIQQAAASGHESTARLYELVILADSGDCPDASLRHADGHFHTGDLFEIPVPGLYLARGRDDDWIKTQTSLRCDTKAIEDNVRATCSKIVAECVVVGAGRPSPALFVEPIDDSADSGKLKKEIIRKIRHFHSRRYVHERIVSANMIIIVPRNSLPRTAVKGNIRRKAVEDAFRTELDQAYALESGL